MKFQKSLTLKALSLVVISLLLLQACKKDPDNIGADIIPDSGKPNLAFTDTISIRAKSILVDSLRTDETTNNLFGSYLDPVFGKSNAAFYAQFRLPAINPDFGENPVVDSVILSLRYDDAYGDTNTPLTMHVYELADQIDRGEVYYSDVDLSVQGFDYADYTFKPRPSTFEIDPESGDTITFPVLNVNLSRFSNELGEKILNADSSYLSDNTLFTEYFKGLYIKPEAVNENGSICYFDLLSGNSRLTIYYHIDTVAYSYVLAVNENSARINQFSHDYQIGSTEFVQQVLESDSSLGKEQLYLQSMGGVRAQLFFPHLGDFRDQGNYLINEAKLIIPVENDDSQYVLPKELGLIRSNEGGNFEFMIDEIETPVLFGGEYDAVNKNYSFRITRYIQKLLLDDFQDYGINLYISSPASNAYHMLIEGTGSGNDPQNRMRLEVKYTLPE